MQYITDAARMQAQERYDEIMGSFKDMIDAFHEKYGEELYDLFNKVEEPAVKQGNISSMLAEVYLELIDKYKGK